MNGAYVLLGIADFGFGISARCRYIACSVTIEVLTQLQAHDIISGKYFQKHGSNIITYCLTLTIYVKTGDNCF
jgi:hypothetical protein